MRSVLVEKQTVGYRVTADSALRKAGVYRLEDRERRGRNDIKVEGLDSSVSECAMRFKTVVLVPSEKKFPVAKPNARTPIQSIIPIPLSQAGQ